ncbi:MAG: beta-galactosidase [Puniceicoccaceae bacterium]|nr:MAG: beta-galactosidase [Puniceicoccaceae bacterium]
MSKPSQLTPPRPEYPRPLQVRADWLCLNGPWSFEDDPGDSGEERGLRTHPLADAITVPFCREAKLSGLARTDRCAAVWYAREVAVPGAWQGRRIWLHFGAADYDTTVWVNDAEVGRHQGGTAGFRFEITDQAAAGKTARIVVRCRDDWWSIRPRGKQATKVHPHGCWYTRTTGIWQTVWLEPTAAAFLERPRITPCLADSSFHLEQRVNRGRPGQRIEAELSDASGVVARAETTLGHDLCPRLILTVPADRRVPWEPGNPHLYDLALTLKDQDGAVLDKCTSYAGLRGIAIDGHRILLNGKPVFQRLILDQGYYPDGVQTAPTDADLVRDIELAMAAGFNGARLHQKVFEERFLFHADRLGYLVWGEFADWCHDFDSRARSRRWDLNFVSEWLEVLERDYSHPAIIGWCPLNEQLNENPDHRESFDHFIRALYFAAKAADTSRPVLDVSGWTHRVPDADVYDWHSYEQDPEKLAERMAPLRDGAINVDWKEKIHVPYRGQPFILSEFGGIKWVDGDNAKSEGWGYGQAVTSLEEFYDRFDGLCRVLLENPGICGYCYTQMTDIPPEMNGLFRFDRSAKFDLKRLAQSQQRPAAIEDTSG